MNIQTKNFGEITLINFTELTKDDLCYVLKMRNHLDIKKWMYNQNNFTEEQHFSFVEYLKTEPTKRYFLVKKSSETVGSINFTHIDRQKKTVELGLYANPFKQVSGAGRMLLEASITYGKKQFNLRSLNLEVFADNSKALNFYNKNGFTQVGTKVMLNQLVLCMNKQISESE